MISAPLGEVGLSCGSTTTRALFHCFDDHGKIAVAVSGGSDSLALLYMLAAWAKERGKYLHCLTVDHSLRAASASEAAMVGEHCARLGIAHDILTWDGEKPATGLSNAARDARYELMAERCFELAISDLVLGHQCDDQAETLLMRLLRSNQGGRGLAGMPHKTEFWSSAGNKITLHRPLLDLSRMDLQTFLLAHAVKWVSDPTNDNNAYERVRARAALENNTLFCEQLISYAKVSARHRAAMSLIAANFITEKVEPLRFGALSLDKAALVVLPEPAAILVLQTLLSVVGGRDYLPSVQKVQPMLANLGGQTLARVHIHDEDQSIYLTREVRNLPSLQKLGAGPVIWDKRVFIQPTAYASLANADLVSGCDLDADIVAEFVEGLRSPLSKVEKNALHSSPFLIFAQEGKIKSLLCLEESDLNSLGVQPHYGSFQRFCGAFDLPIRRALEGLLTK